MKTKWMSAILLAFFLTPALQLAKAQSDDELKTKIEKINDDLAKAMMEGNSEKSLSYYAADAVSLPDFAPMAEGIEAIKKSNQAMMESGFKVNSCDFITKKVTSYGKVITEIGAYEMKFSMPGSSDLMEDQGKYLNIWEKQPDGSLKIKVEMWNTNKMPQM